MDYKDIARVNSEIKTIDLKGKEYAMVAERVLAFRKLYPQGFITSEIVSINDKTVLIKTSAGYYKDTGEIVLLGTGFAQETFGRGLVNSTSFVENAETSAVGRALGFMGFGLNGGDISSAEELSKALDAKQRLIEDFEQQKKEIEAQKLAALNDGVKEIRHDAPAEVTRVTMVPESEAAGYMRIMIGSIQKKYDLKTYEAAKKKVLDWIDSLVKSGALDPIDFKTMSLDEAVNAFNAIKDNFMAGDQK